MNKKQIQEILSEFSVGETILRVDTLQSGYINKTYLIEVGTNPPRQLILQRINTSVFPKVDDLMDNVSRLCRHIDKRLKSKECDIDYTNLHFYTATTGKYFTKHQNDYFRLLDYIPHRAVEPGGITSETAAEAGRTLGRFHLLTHDMNPQKIVEVLPDFHRLDLRYERFESIDTAANPRFATSRDFYQKVLGFEYLIEAFKTIIHADILPVRVVHNDPKRSNMLFDASGRGMTMIDLDTVMPGYLGNDFGDAIRSLANTAAEHELDLNKVHFDDELYRHFSAAYIDTVKEIISLREKESLPKFIMFITFEQLIRFYTDYLQGDVYYPVAYPEQNLQRAKVQWKLLREMAGLISGNPSG